MFKSLGYEPDQHGTLRVDGVGSRLILTITGPQATASSDALERQLQAEWASCGIGLIMHNVSMNSLLKTVLPRGRYQLALAPFVMPAFPTWNAIIYTDRCSRHRLRSPRISVWPVVQAAHGNGAFQRLQEPSPGRSHWKQ